MTKARPRGRWVVVAVMAAMLLPWPARGRSPEGSWPDGVCGSPRQMMEAAQSGSAMVQQVMAYNMPWGDKALNEYVNRLGQNLARSSGSDQPFAFYVVYNPKVNAQAFPGGNIVVNTGVISVAENEAELASVLSHEIAHENECDWRPSMSRGNLFELAAVIPTVMLGGPIGIVLMSATGMVSPVARARSDRSVEERADRLGAQYLVRAGYDPQAAVHFFARLATEQARDGSEEKGVMATHPRTVDREKQLEKLIPSLPAPESLPHDETEFLRLRKSVRDYDDIYATVTGSSPPGQEPPPPVLRRRSPQGTGQSTLGHEF